MFKAIFTFSLFLFFTQLINAQNALDITLNRQCNYSQQFPDEELFDYSEKSICVNELINEILILTNSYKNFEIVETNVDNTTAVLHNNKRYLLYSIDFIVTSDISSIDVYATLAHEIGHHINKHTFDDNKRFKEESEADFFMGYLLSKKTFSENDIKAFFKKLPSSYSINNQLNRENNVFEGFKKANKALVLNGLNWDTDPYGKNSLMSSFSLKKCYSSLELTNLSIFKRAKNYGQVSDKILQILEKNWGNNNVAYYSIPEGFAIVTHIEQYDGVSGAIINSNNRWISEPYFGTFDSFWDYFSYSNLFTPKKAYYRVFVFIVGNKFPFPDKDALFLSKSEAELWLKQSTNSTLPNEFRNKQFSKIWACVYEFEVPQSTYKPKQICPAPRFEVTEHLKKAMNISF